MYVKKPGRPSNPIPEEVRFNWEQFHYPMRTGEANERRDCVVHKQSVRTYFKCAVCECPMCPDLFFRYHTMLNFKYDDPTKTREKSGRKRAKKVN